MLQNNFNELNANGQKQIIQFLVCRIQRHIFWWDKEN